jgi:hypothetical protein
MKGALPFLLMVAGLTAAVSLAAPLPDFEATYRLEQHKLRIGTATIALHTDKQGNYQYEFRSSPTRWVSLFSNRSLYESSRGELGAGGIRPEQYDYRRSGDRQRNARLAFDWSTMVVENDVAGSHWKMDIVPGTVDKLATQLGMMIALGEGKQDVTYSVADGGSLKEYRYRVIGKETLDLPAGTFRTVKVVKLRKDIDQQVVIWFAPELHYLPVRIWRRDSDDEEYTSDLEKFSRSLWGKSRKR